MTKYRNKKVTLDGMTFDSKAECRRYQELQILARAGHITDLSRQASFILAPGAIVGGKAKRALIYRADFVYQDSKSGARIVEDCKGVMTQAFRIKQHLMKTVLGIDVLITK